ncbi:YHYH domain-containing protein [Desulfovibrio sp. OttesenSCG-928-O18]|nr:YHYH domain-containing protein [Desulfovibrio sp. OttesenSCG-928-O18]
MRFLFLIIAAVMLSPLQAAAHGGGLDGYGCHNDRKNGGYHCHRGPFAGRSFASQGAMLRELNGARKTPQKTDAAKSNSEKPAQKQ